MPEQQDQEQKLLDDLHQDLRHLQEQMTNTHPLRIYARHQNRQAARRLQEKIQDLKQSRQARDLSQLRNPRPGVPRPEGVPLPDPPKRPDPPP